MAKLVCTLLLIFSLCHAHARSLSYAIKTTESTVPETPLHDFLGMPGRFLTGCRPGTLPASAPARSGLKFSYDVTLETGAYFFDSVYRLRVPATKHLQIGFNGGYTFYDRYMHGFGKGGGSLGLVGGLTLMFYQAQKASGTLRKSFLRLNADLVSYPYKYGASKDPYSLSRYTRDLSARIYVDARLTRRYLTTRCMLGLSSGTEQMTDMPFFVGLGFGFRFP